MLPPRVERASKELEEKLKREADAAAESAAAANQRGGGPVLEVGPQSKLVHKLL